MRFLTLTSADGAPDDIQRSWRKLYMRMKRRNMLEGYVKVPEVAEDGRQHLHVLFRGSYVAHAWLKATWLAIHESNIVDIRAFQVWGTAKRAANYMAKYMSKDGAGRYSWSWGWVWRGFVRDWCTYKKWWWAYQHQDGVNGIKNMVYGWDCILKGLATFDWDLARIIVAPVGVR